MLNPGKDLLDPGQDFFNLEIDVVVTGVSELLITPKCASLRELQGLTRTPPKQKKL